MAYREEHLPWFGDVFKDYFTFDRGKVFVPGGPRGFSPHASQLSVELRLPPGVPLTQGLLYDLYHFAFGLNSILGLFMNERER
jgi:hypothetical protein